MPLFLFKFLFSFNVELMWIFTVQGLQAASFIRRGVSVQVFFYLTSFRVLYRAARAGDTCLKENQKWGQVAASLGYIYFHHRARWIGQRIQVSLWLGGDYSRVRDMHTEVWESVKSSWHLGALSYRALFNPRVPDTPPNPIASYKTNNNKQH